MSKEDNMVKIVSKISYYLGIILSIVYNEYINNVFFVIRNNVYSGIIKRRFKVFNGIIKGGRIRLRGGSYIEVGNNTVIYERCKIECTKINVDKNPSLYIGHNTRIMQDCIISCFNQICIGDNVGIAPKVFISDAVHGDFSEDGFEKLDKDGIPIVFKQKIDNRSIISKGPIIIEDGVHIGFNCVICPGVTIGHNSIINAMTVVTKNIPPYSIVSGNPGKIIITYGR